MNIKLIAAAGFCVLSSALPQAHSIQNARDQRTVRSETSWEAPAVMRDGPNDDRWDDWTVVTDDSGVLPTDSRVALKNEVSGLFAAYGARSWGINLVWRDAGRARNFRLTRGLQNQTVCDGPCVLRTGDRVAIEVEGGGWLKYEPRDYGINLVWSDTPEFEWELRGQPTRSADVVSIGAAVASQGRYGLFNHKAEDYVVYCERSWGINLRWMGDCNDRMRSDLVVAEITTVPSHPFPSTGPDPSPMRIQWRECNHGAGDSVPFVTTVEWSSQFGVTLEFASQLDSGECKNRSLIVALPYSAGTDQITVTVDSGTSSNEADESNNQLSKAVEVG